MAEFFWERTYRSAAALCLLVLGFLALVDRLTREAFVAPADRWMAVVALGCGLVGATMIATPLEGAPRSIRLIPTVTGVLAVTVAVHLGDVFDATASPVALSIAAFVILAYTGLALAPGHALVVAPFLLVILAFARASGADAAALAVPVIAVPVAAMVGELISHLARQSDAASARSTRRMDQLHRLEEVLRRFRRPGSLNQAAHQVAEAAREIFEVERSTVVLRDARGELISVTVGPTTSKRPAATIAGILSEVMSSDQPRLVPTGSNGTMLVLPFPAPEVPAGVVIVYPIPTDDAPFTLDLARLFGVQVGIAIDHLFVIDELARANTRDALTGMGNRRHAEALLDSLQPGDALVLLDLDGFKSVNDTLGHSAGDQVLQDLSAHLRDCLRDSDTSARLGGDEFLIVARRAHADPLAVATRVLEGWAEKSGPTTLSAGVALHQDDATEPLDTQVTFERADRALYQAKAAGKNRAQLWDAARETADD